ncbi:MAG: hypothetical protein C0417_05025 [Chlorobiaceae bacterium]|nr:hypothetical protein [Chlorobiaceae bacterium]
MRKLLVVNLILLVILSLSCEGPMGPTGPQGPAGDTGSLTDPTIMPRVISTFPPANSTGPYEFLNYYSPHIIQVRFNKIMDHGSIKRAFSITSPGLDVRIDSSYIYSYGGDLFRIYVDDSLGHSYRWKFGKTYTFGIASSAKDVNGNALNPAYSMTFTPEPYFRIKDIYPPNGAQNVNTGSSISLIFNSPVDTSIFSFIQITPPISGRWRVDSYDSTYLYYSYANRLSHNATYTINIQQSAKDKYGNQLQQPFNSSFTTGTFRVSSTYPQNGMENIHLTNSVEIYFTNYLDTSTIRRSFSITPNVNGYLNFNNNSSYLYFNHYSDEFIPETTYTVRIDTSIRSANGDRMLSPYQFSFRTAPFKITYTYPYDGSTNVSRYLSSISVECNSSIDTSTIRSSFSIPGITGYSSSYYGSNYFYFYPTNTPLDANTTYTATISTSLKSIKGARLKEPYSFSFTTGY